MPRVTVVIPNWNGLAHLPECMDALRAQTYQDFSVLVVDNGSSDESVAWLSANAPDVAVIARSDNGGFAVAVNEGIRACGTELVALLNNDTAVEPQWLAELVAALDRTGFDCAASLMLFYEDPSLVNAAGDVYDMASFAGLNRGFRRPVGGFLEPARVLGACAGAALYRVSMFDDVGLFDEDFFLIHEDTDFNLRALIAGKRCVYAPAARLRHKLSATIRHQPSWPMLRYETRNRGIVIGKDLPPSIIALALLTWPWRLFRSTIPLRPAKWHLIPGLTANLGKRIAAEIEGLRMGLRKRGDVWSRQGIPTREIIRWLFNGSRSL